MDRTPATTWATIGALLILAVLIGKLNKPIQPQNLAMEPRLQPAESLPIRLVEGRLSGQRKYAPYPTVPNKLREAALIFRNDKESPHGDMMYCLVRSDLDGAVSSIEEATRKNPGDASLLSDLSALYIERARVKQNPENFVAALEMADRAIALNPELSEPYFNRALALERLTPWIEPMRGWVDYSRHTIRGDDLGWSQEALARLTRINNMRKLILANNRADSFKTIRRREQSALA